MAGAIDISQPVRLTAPKGKYVAIIVLGAFFLVMGILLGVTDEWFGWLLAGLGAIVGTVGVMMLSPDRNALDISADGLVLHLPFQKKRWRWDQIGELMVARISRSAGGYGGQSRAVAFTLAGDAESAGVKEKIRDVRGWDEFIPETYGMDPDELCALLDDWRIAVARSGGKTGSR